MPVRRAADPTSVQHVWDAIRFANAQRQMADSSRIIKYLQRVDNCSQVQAELYLKQTLDDGLIIALQKVTVKGAKTGEQVESFKIPIVEMLLPEKDGRDWYCIDCHLAGDVIPCSSCHRVYHPECGYKKQQAFKFPVQVHNLDVAEKHVPLPSPKNLPFSEDDVINVSDELNDSVEQQSGKNSDQSVMVEDNNMENGLKSVKSSPELSENNKENGVSGCKINVSLLEEQTTNEYDKMLCSICNMCKIAPHLPLEKNELNYLLRFVHSRIKSWLPVQITETLSSEEKPEWLTESEMNWRANQLIYQSMSMATMETKLEMEEYETVGQFQADVMTIYHNIALYHGIESQEFGAAEFMKKDCDYDTLELMNCVDCYKHSNEKINQKWFCLPCRVPHMLVWAKQKGYPYWPAKVIKIVDDNYDVRFFGGKYERSILPSSQIKPITNPPKEVHGKKGTALAKAIEELKIHQRLLASPNELQKFLATIKKKKHVINKHSKTSLDKVQKPNIKQNNKTMELSLKNVYDFTESSESPPSSVSTIQSQSKLKRKRSTSPSIKGKPVRTEDYSTRRSLQNQNQSSIGAGKPIFDVDTLNTSLDLDDQDVFAVKDEDYELQEGVETSHEEVSSSTERVSANERYSRDNSDGLMPRPERQYSEAVEKLRRKMEQCRSKSELIAIALDDMQNEIDRTKNEHDEYLKKVFEAHNAQISETKKKQWCYNCEQDAIYHCCWNTAYCSLNCQQSHWQAEHKKVCRRKR